MKSNIILTGMMGSGKSTVGKELSSALPSYKFIDIDEEIEKNTGKKISEIFLQHGEKYFRMLESEKIKKYYNAENMIISIGGGAFENEETRKLLLDNCRVIYLKTSAEEIFHRIKLETHRPLLRKNLSLEKIETIIKNRSLNYEKAHYKIDTTGKTPYNVMEEIRGVLNE